MISLTACLIGASLICASPEEIGSAPEQSKNQGVQAPSVPNQIPSAQMKALYEDRSRIRSCHLEFKIEFHTCAALPEMEGRTRECSVWFYSGKPRKFRVEYKDVAAKGTSKLVNSKYAESNNVHMVINIANDPEVVVQEITKDYDRLDFFDPRLMGLMDVPQGGLANYGLDELRVVGSLSSSSETRTNRVSGERRDIIHYKTLPSGSLVYKFMNGHTLPCVISADLTYRNVRVQSKTEIVLMRYKDGRGQGIEFPKEIRYTERRDEKKYYDETLTVRKASFNEHLDDSMFTWCALKHQYGALLLKDGDFSNMRGWDGSKFTLKPDKKAAPHASSRRSGMRLVSLVILTIGMPLLAISVALVLRCRGSAAESP